LFSRRVIILAGAYVLVGLVLLLRLAQVQIGWHDSFNPEDYTVLGGGRITETVRGGIYTRWGTPLARQVPSFDLGVHYSYLLVASESPWQHTLVRRYIDEFLRRDGPAGWDDEYKWDDYARPVRAGGRPDPPPAGVAASDRYRYLWSVRHVESRRYGSMESFVRRRLQGESARTIAASPAPADADWLGTVARLTGVTAEQIAAEARGTVQRVERIQRAVQQGQNADPNENYIRVVEQGLYHPIVRDIATDVAVLIRSSPDAYPGLRVIESARREYPNGSLAPHIVGRVQKLSPERWQQIVDASDYWTMAMPLSTIGKRYKMEKGAGGRAARHPGLYGPPARLPRATR